jgi:hypothetical protein
MIWYARVMFMHMLPIYLLMCWSTEFIGLAYEGKDIVFRFIIEYSNLRDFGP